MNVNEVEYQATKTAIQDFGDLPSNRKTAVRQCYALGILTGMGGGTFSGEPSMTRAQACAVIVRMCTLINGDVPSGTPQKSE